MKNTSTAAVSEATQPAEFIAVVYPPSKSIADLRDLNDRIKSRLGAVSIGKQPLLINTDATALCYLVRGHADPIKRAMADAALTGTCYLLAPIGKPTEATGLSRAYQWCTAHA